jgi:Fe-S-cluster containining protein
MTSETSGKPGRDELAATLVQLRRRVDDHFDAAVQRSPTAFACAAGCSACCHTRIGVFPIEAAPIERALARLAIENPALRARVRRQADDPAHADRCALLVDDRCAVYSERPLICRSHGLPITAPTETAPTEAPAPQRIDHCPLNFVDQPPPRASILRLDAVNQPLAVLATLWSAPPGPARSPGPGTRILLADLARGGEPPRSSPDRRRRRAFALLAHRNSRLTKARPGSK